MAWDSPWTAGQPAPRVNLLPREVTERRLARRQRAGAGVGLLVLLVLLGLWYALATARLHSARAAADRQQATVDAQRAERLRLQPYADLQAQVTAAEQLRAQVYAKEIRFSGILQDLSAIVPSNVWLTQLNATFKDTTGAAATAATASSGSGGQAVTTPGSPGAGAPVASITFSGAGLGHVDVGSFMRALAGGPRRRGQRIYLNPYFTSSQKAAGSGGQATVTFTATVDMSQAAFSGRYQSSEGQGP